MDVGYTRLMEGQLDLVEEENLDWVKMLHEFYEPFKRELENAHGTMVHAKAELEPAPHLCPQCGAATVYRFGKNGKFLSCSRYPECKYAAPIDREGNPQQAEVSDILCPTCGGEMTRRVGRFGAFLGCKNYPECKGILKLDPKKGHVVLPKPPPLLTNLACPKCGSPLNLRRSARGPWLSCSAFPKCRGRMAWSALEPKQQQELEAQLTAHEAANPVPEIKNSNGRVLGGDYVPRIAGTEASSSPPDVDAA
jgi:DNA topoisomerase-1